MTNNIGRVDTFQCTPIITNVKKDLGYSSSEIKVADRILTFIKWYHVAFPTREVLAQGDIHVDTVTRAIKKFKRDKLFIVTSMGIKKPNCYRIGSLVNDLEHRQYLIEILPEISSHFNLNIHLHMGMSDNSNIQSQHKFPFVVFDTQSPYSLSEIYQKAYFDAVEVPRNIAKMKHFVPIQPYM